MLYLLDANVVITAHNQYYPIGAVPEFWKWLVHQGEAGAIKMPIETFEEIKGGTGDEAKDVLYAWIQEKETKAALLLDEEVVLEIVQKVVEEGYAADLTDSEQEQLGQDPFLIAHALASSHDRCVVSTEASKPNKIRQNRRIPDVCRSLGVSVCDTFEMLRALKFTTAWARSVGR